jgi:hypothetical protein
MIVNADIGNIVGADYWDVIRIINAGICIALMIEMTIRYLRFDTGVQGRMYRLGWTGILGALTINTVSAVIHQYPGGPLLFSYTIPLIWLLVASHFPVFTRIHCRYAGRKRSTNAPAMKDSSHESK